jgi:hypothetical protein
VESGEWRVENGEFTVNSLQDDSDEFIGGLLYSSFVNVKSSRFSKGLQVTTFFIPTSSFEIPKKFKVQG